MSRSSGWAGKERAADIAGAAAGAACAFAIVSAGTGGPACAAAIAALAYAMSEAETARDKSSIAMSAYFTALTDYLTCLAKMSRTVTP